MTPDARPPRWAETILRLLLKPVDRECVSGDLLEEYRDSIRPARGRWGADVWYVRQVAGFAWRAGWVCTAPVCFAPSGDATDGKIVGAVE